MITIYILYITNPTSKLIVKQLVQICHGFSCLFSKGNQVESTKHLLLHTFGVRPTLLAHQEPKA